MAVSSSFPFGQYRRESNFNYIQWQTSGITNSEYWNRPSDSINEGIIFEDRILSFANALTNGSYYYLRIKVKRNFTNQILDIRLQTSNSMDDASLTSQYLGRYEVPQQVTENEFSILELIIQPRANYSYIVISLQRTLKDDYLEYDEYNPNNAEQIIGRKIEIESISYGTFENIISRMTGSGATSINTLDKIGIQANPGTLFCINGESIRIGPSGIYEINNGYQINFLGAAVGVGDGITSQDTFDYEYFTIDYRYK